MHIQKLHTPEYVKEECVVVIDVLRAFTTAAYAFSKGAEKIIPIGTTDEAFTLKQQFPNSRLMGEIKGLPIEGFDFGNSPFHIAKENLSGCTLIQRTSAGTQGVVRSIDSQNILVASFVTASATLKRIQKLNPKKVTFIITGNTNGDEDLAFADYLHERLIKNEHVDPTPFLHRVEHSPEGISFSKSTDPRLPKEDLYYALSLDRFDFAMEISKKESIPVLYATRD